MEGMWDISGLECSGRGCAFSTGSSSSCPQEAEDSEALGGGQSQQWKEPGYQHCHMEEAMSTGEETLN